MQEILYRKTSTTIECLLTKSFIELMFVGTNKLFSSNPNVIYTREICGQRASIAVKTKRRALPFIFPCEFDICFIYQNVDDSAIYVCAQLGNKSTIHPLTKTMCLLLQLMWISEFFLIGMKSLINHSWTTVVLKLIMPGHQLIFILFPVPNICWSIQVRESDLESRFSF